MSVTELMQHIELFFGLAPEQIEQIAALGQELVFNAGDIIIREGDLSDEVYVIRSGTVEVLVSGGVIADVPGAPRFAQVVRLGQGQLFGEMALVDRGVRSATVRCVEDSTVLHVIPGEAFWALCDSDHHVGCVVARNVASDLSFKLRHRNLQAGLVGGGYDL